MRLMRREPDEPKLDTVGIVRGFDLDAVGEFWSNAEAEATAA